MALRWNRTRQTLLPTDLAASTSVKIATKYLPIDSRRRHRSYNLILLLLGTGGLWEGAWGRTRIDL